MHLCCTELIFRVECKRRSTIASISFVFRSSKRLFQHLYWGVNVVALGSITSDSNSNFNETSISRQSLIGSVATIKLNYVALTMHARRLTSTAGRPRVITHVPAPTRLYFVVPSVYKRFVNCSNLRLRMEKRSVFLSLPLILALVQLAVCQDSPDCSALQVPFSGAPFSGELASYRTAWPRVKKNKIKNLRNAPCTCVDMPVWKYNFEVCMHVYFGKYCIPVNLHVAL